MADESDDRFIYDVFLSYAHADEEPEGDNGPAATLAGLLEARGYRVYWDRKLQGGQAWMRMLSANIRASRRTILLISPKWLQSDFCQREMFAAYAVDGATIPVVIEHCELPGEIDHVQAIFATGDLALYEAPIVAAIGFAPERDRVTGASTAPQALPVAIDDLPSGAMQFVGRDTELSLLLDAWGSGARVPREGAKPSTKTNAVVLHAIGGAGKSALVRRFLDELADRGWPGADAVYGWSAYSQGSGENRNADAEGFLEAALKWFGYDGPPITDAVERGRTLADLVKRRRTLLVLDGLEPLQDLPHVNEGRLKDKGLKALIEALAADNPGLVVITSRQELPELARVSAPRVRNHALDVLDPRAGAELLKALGCHGRETELMAAVDAVAGHALSVTVLGTYLAAVCGGDITQVDTFHFADVVADEDNDQDRATAKVRAIMRQYVARFEALEARSKGGGTVERLILTLVGLFDRPAEAEIIAALLAAPAIPGVTDDWHAMRPQEQA
ncbi:MAG: toll/interleukin-1 receptor domain-containing protein, partial [Pseudomonadota bacterium]